MCRRFPKRNWRCKQDSEPITLVCAERQLFLKRGDMKEQHNCCALTWRRALPILSRSISWPKVQFVMAKQVRRSNFSPNA